MQSLLILAFFCLVGWCSPQRCPAKYLRFTPQHSYCLSPSRSCQIKHTGVSQQEKQLILNLHNQFRSKTAMGNEHRSKGGSLPKAADMIQMEWDDELAAIAQKWTENCKFEHDCRDCRTVENFSVGQNLAITNIPCPGHRCQEPSNEPDWTWAITGFYDEVSDYHVNWLYSYRKHPGPQTGHFTQVIWSKSWKVGCGYSYYKQGGAFHRYHACNYGPGGNLEGKPVYKQGRPCSACPTNSQCSTPRRGQNSFPGLCKMTNLNAAPVYPRNYYGVLFYCGDSNSDSDCQAQTSGDGNWKTVRSIGGNYNSVVLRGGQSTTITFNTPIRPHGDKFCINLNFRKGPLDASRRDESTLKVNFQMDYARARSMEIHKKTTGFMVYNVNAGWGIKTKLGLTFSVRRGAGKHAVDIRKVKAYDGSCISARD